MSEVVRSMSRSERFASPSVGGGVRRGGFRITRWILLLIALSGVYLWWISRDTHDVQPFIMSRPAAVIVAQDVVQRRGAIFASPSWNALPAQAQEHSVPATFGLEFDTPDWVLRNLFGQNVLVIVPSDYNYDESIYLSRMSRFGVLIERALRRSSSNVRDPAGGLELRYLEENEMYYAVRGRLLIASSSRRSLVSTLTLGEKELIADEAWDNEIWNVGAEDLRGTVRLSEQSRWGNYFEGIGFALRVDEDGVVLKLKMPCTDSFYDEYIPGLEGVGAESIYAPESGPIQFSANIGESYYDTFRILEVVLEVPEGAEEPWLIGLLERNIDSTIGNMLMGTGSAIARTWHGYTLDDIVPGHIVSTIAANNGEVIAQAIAQAPTEESGAYEEVARRADPERNWLEIESIGGPALTDVVSLDASKRTVRAATSRIQAELNGWDTETSPKTLETPVNLYIGIDPGAVLTELEAFIAELELGLAISESEALERNNQVALWREQMRSIQLIELTAEHDPDSRSIQATLSIR